MFFGKVFHVFEGFMKDRKANSLNVEIFVSNVNKMDIFHILIIYLEECVSIQLSLIDV